MHCHCVFGSEFAGLVVPCRLLSPNYEYPTPVLQADRAGKRDWTGWEEQHVHITTLAFEAFGKVLHIVLIQGISSVSRQK